MNSDVVMVLAALLITALSFALAMGTAVIIGLCVDAAIRLRQWQPAVLYLIVLLCSYYSMCFLDIELPPKLQFIVLALVASFSSALVALLIMQKGTFFRPTARPLADASFRLKAGAITTGLGVSALLVVRGIAVDFLFNLGVNVHVQDTADQFAIVGTALLIGVPLGIMLYTSLFTLGCNIAQILHGRRVGK